MDVEINRPDSPEKSSTSTETGTEPPMNRSRLSRIEEKRTRKQFIWIIVGIVATILFVFTIGIPLVVGVSVLLGNLKSQGTVTDTKDTTAPFPPTLSPVAIATNSAQIKIEGYGEAETELTLLVNGRDVKQTMLPADGNFSFDDIELDEGLNTIYATVKDSAGNESNPSNELSVSYNKDAPKLEVSEPQDGQSFGRSQQEIMVNGKTDPGNQVTINERFVPVTDEGTFTFAVRLSDGENTLVIVARDAAGNETKLERKVTFQPES